MLAPKTSPDSPITTVNSCGMGNGQPAGQLDVGAGLSDPKAHTQPGSIVIGPRDRDRGAKTKRISLAGI